MLPTALRGIIAMDVNKLNKEIISALDTDKAVQSYLGDINNTQYARWSKDTLGFIQIDERIYIPPFGDLHLRVLCSYHNHPVSGHFGCKGDCRAELNQILAGGPKLIYYNKSTPYKFQLT